MSSNLNAAVVLRDRMQGKFGAESAMIAGDMPRPDVIPTGILALDYALEVGGWPRGAVISIFGPENVGKSSMLGLAAIAQAQKQGLLCGIVLVEPRFDPVWAEKHGVNVDELLLSWPTDGKEAWDQAQMLVESGSVGLVMVDSVGSMLSASEADAEGEMKVGGQAGLITWGVKRLAPMASRTKTTVLLINQVRDVMSARMSGVVDMPGGHALKHMSDIIVQLRNHAEAPYVVKADKDHPIEIGRKIVAKTVRNKYTEGDGQRAIFDFYKKTVEGYPFGIDRVADIIATGLLSGAIQSGGGGYYTLPDGTRVRGKEKVAEHIDKHPEMVEVIRTAVLKDMQDKLASQWEDRKKKRQERLERESAPVKKRG